MKKRPDFSAGHGLSEAVVTRIASLKEYVLSEATRHKIDLGMSRYFGRNDFIVFLSLSDGSARSLVTKGIGETLESAWETAEKNMLAIASGKAYDAGGARADIVNSTELIRAGELDKRVVDADDGFYFRKGIAFDKNFSVAFPEAEVNSNNLIDYNARNSVVLNLNNINSLENYSGGNGLKKIPNVLTLFTTIGFVIGDREVYDLHSGDVDECETSSSFISSKCAPRNGKYLYDRWEWDFGLPILGSIIWVILIVLYSSVSKQLFVFFSIVGIFYFFWIWGNGSGLRITLTDSEMKLQDGFLFMRKTFRYSDMACIIFGKLSDSYKK